ncbi:MAG: dihydropteroate synthase [Nitrospirae bacterium]|nr:dihydropteroate synthase [Nitrospirota bacterium]MBF0541174.1 dihydropteroate synthase [Nitrospirota bacterium]
MGILNVTPDSFSDGARYLDKNKAINHAVQMAQDGADIIDIGGESTRPGSIPITIEEELQRVIPVIKELSKQINIPISIDTYKSKVAKAAIDSGASIINDISAFHFDPKMAGLAASTEVPVILMHIKGTPKDMQNNPDYRDLFSEIIDYLNDGIKIALQAGVSKYKIIIDPGIGFGKTFQHNIKIIQNLNRFKRLDKPILIGVSRKAFIGAILDNAPAQERLIGSVSTALICAMNGANILRVHDVKETVQSLKILKAFHEQPSKV